MKLLAIDPGLRGCGCAYFDGPTLVRAYYAANPLEKGDGPSAWFALADAIYADFKAKGHRVDFYVVELMQVYKFGGGNPADLLELAGVGGAIGAMFPLEPSAAAGYLPRTWKGSVAKHVHQPRVLAQLSDAEIEAIEEHRKTYAEHVVDAIGLGLFHLERTRVRMTSSVTSEYWRSKPYLAGLAVPPKAKGGK